MRGKGRSGRNLLLTGFGIAGLLMCLTELPVSAAQTDDSKAPKREIFHFVDVCQQEYLYFTDPAVARHAYDREAFVRDGDRLFYTDRQGCKSRLGVDVSHHQGKIDWKQVKAAGYEFAFLRIGYRGYGEEGKLCADREFENNIKGAQEAGLDVGVYFFAQAVNEAEALEEAAFVLELLKDYELQLPVVYDPESILDAKARTDNVTKGQFTKNAAAFCEAVKKAGYEPMIYCNMLWQAFKLDLAQLSAYPIWYADYEAAPQTPYQFTFWQYSNTANVPGIEGDADVDIQMIQK